MKYDFAAIEKKWQEKWEQEKPYAAVTGDKRPKFYGLIEFPYPSGQGLHVGHPRPFTAMDIDSDLFPIVPADVLDMIIVPLVAFDQTGARLGYGGGCYDRYLPTLSATCQIIGIAFDEQRVNHVPTNAHDLPLPHIVSA